MSSRSEAQVETARRAVAPAVAQLGLDLYDVELLGGAGARTLRVSITREGGVDLDAITAATQAISPLLDQTPDLAGPYLLEVSSPGVERTLRRPEHFQGAIGEQVSIKFHTEAGPRRVRGALVEFDDEHCTVEEDGVKVQIPLHDVTQARTVFEWGPQPRPGQKAAKAGAGKT